MKLGNKTLAKIKNHYNSPSYGVEGVPPLPKRASRFNWEGEAPAEPLFAWQVDLPRFGSAGASPSRSRIFPVKVDDRVVASYPSIESKMRGVAVQPLVFGVEFVKIGNMKRRS